MRAVLRRLANRSWRVAPVAVSLALFCTTYAHAFARHTAQTPSISGNWPVAVAIALFALWALILVIRGVLFLERRDAWLGRGAQERDDYWISD
jgi:TRAP-type C4-dicarboxylate transport system permease small subunit